MFHGLKQMCSLQMNMITHHSNSGCQPTRLHATSYSIQHRARTKCRVRWVGGKLPNSHQPVLPKHALCCVLYEDNSVYCSISPSKSSIGCINLPTVNLMLGHTVNRSFFQAPHTCMQHALGLQLFYQFNDHWTSTYLTSLQNNNKQYGLYQVLENLQRWVNRKPANLNPGLKVNESINFSSTKMFSQRLFKLKTRRQTR